MRQFNLVVLDESDLIVDRYELPIVTNIKGLGYEVSLSTIETDIKNYITKIVQLKRDINLTIVHKDRYAEEVTLKKWIQKNYNKTVCLEYINSYETLYCEGYVTSTSFDEINEYNVINNSIVFKPLTPFFYKIENKIYIQRSAYGKMYPFKYPYSYGVNSTLNNEVDNNYFTDVPIIVTIYGTITNPHIVLTDSEGNIYNEVVFNNTFIDEGEKLIINSAQKKIWFVDENDNKTDYYYKLDGGYDSYLRAKENDVSSVNINLTAEDTGYLIGSWRKYTL